MQLFYNTTIAKETTQLTFDKVESRHIVKVLRKKEGDALHITNGKGSLFVAEIVVANDKKCTVQIVEHRHIPNNRGYYLHIAIAPTKNNDRMEWFLEKATEIGIDEITPIICDNSERRTVKLQRFQKIVQSAMKQSLQYHLPLLHEPKKFSDFILEEIEGSKYIAHCEDGEKSGLNSMVTPAETVTILIGPEGDFSSKEIEKAIEKGYKPVSLGENRLRTETAAMVATQSIAFLNQK